MNANFGSLFKQYLLVIIYNFVLIILPFVSGPVAEYERPRNEFFVEYNGKYKFGMYYNLVGNLR